MWESMNHSRIPRNVDFPTKIPSEERAHAFSQIETVVSGCGNRITIPKRALQLDGGRDKGISEPIWI